MERPQPDGAGDHLVLLVDDVEDLLALVGVDGAVSDQQGVVGLTDGHTDAGEEAGGERLVLVGEHAPDAQGAGFRIDLVVLEIDRALVGKSLLSGQAQRNGPLGLAVRLGLAFADQLPDAQDGALVHVEVGIHRVHRHDGGEQGAAVLVPRLDQVAHRDDVSADAPADRRCDPRVLQVQRGEVAVGLGDIEVGHRLPVIALVPVIFFLADRPARDQVLDALVVALQSVHAGLDIAPRSPWPARGRPGTAAGRFRRARRPS